MKTKTIELHYTPSTIAEYCAKMVEMNKGRENEKMMKDINTLVKLAGQFLQKNEEK